MPIFTFPRHHAYDEDEFTLKPAGLRDTQSEGKVSSMLHNSSLEKDTPSDTGAIPARRLQREIPRGSHSESQWWKLLRNSQSRRQRSLGRQSQDRRDTQESHQI